MNDKIVVLNSGGFDSVCLMHLTRELYPSAAIHSIFFEYGNYLVEEKYARKVANNVNAVFKKIELPIFDWTKNDFYKDFKQGANDYLEMRNLIFLSYALSYAESIQADFIGCAITVTADEQYYDTSLKFIEDFSRIAEAKNIKIWTPYRGKEKKDMVYDLLKYKITKEDFVSCNFALDDEPCGECEKCKEVNELYNFLEEKGVKF